MCGIVGYVGRRNAVPILLSGLKRLEYRGYDSAGIVLQESGELTLYKAEGKLNALESLLTSMPAPYIPTNYGIGHTRWATHGRPSFENAHPHMDCTNTIAVVHNGIIENYKELKEQLIAEGHYFKSATDTEVIVHLIEKHMDGDLKRAVALTLPLLKGSYALGVISAQKPDYIIAARRFSPLVVGMGRDEYFLASDIPAILEHTNNEIIINDDELVELSPVGIEVTNIRAGKRVSKNIEKINWSSAQAEKGGYNDYMLKEIHEQPIVIREMLQGLINIGEKGKANIAQVTKLDTTKFNSIHIIACGTSYHAGLIGKYLIETLAGVPVEVELASEYRYRTIICNEKTLVIPISQSGETADTLAATQLAKSKGSTVLAVCNVPGSNLTRLAKDTIYTKAGPEIGVASTKAFTTQLVALILLAINCAQQRKKLNGEKLSELALALKRLPGDLERTMLCADQIQEVAKEFYNCSTYLFLGRWINYPIALEGALKLKELSYINGQGYAAGEMKHGPIALIENNVPVVVMAPHDQVYEKVCSNIEEVRARGGSVIAITEEGDKSLKDGVAHLIELPKTHPMLSPVLQVIPLQLLAYHVALLRGCDVDKPRNLAKSVTVE